MTNWKNKNSAAYKRWFTARVTHGAYIGGKESPEHYVWRTMVYRCKSNHPGYEDVRVCKRWMQFEHFLVDMGMRPFKGAELDRKNTFGNYNKRNCRWTTRSIQQKNKRTTRYFKRGNRVGTLVDWARWLKMSKERLWYRWKAWGTFVKGLAFQFRIGQDKWQRPKAA